VELQRFTSGVYIETHKRVNLLEFHEFLAIIDSKARYCLESSITIG
jgi:hypothetical protein